MDSFFNTLSIRNYKAFSEATIEIRPLTFFIGANSSGKSSILQLILALEQTINNRDFYASALKLNGHYVNLGEDINIIKDKKKTNEISIDFGLNENVIKHYFKESFYSEFGDEIIAICFNKKLKMTETGKSDSFDKIRRIVDDLGKETKTNYTRRNVYDDFSTTLRMYMQRQHNNELEESDDYLNKLSAIIDSYYSILQQLKETNGIRLCYKLCIRPRKKRLTIIKCSIRTIDDAEIGYQFSKEDTCIFNLIKGVKIPEQLRIESDVYFNGLQIRVNEWISDMSIRFVNILLNSAYMALKQCFQKDKISYVGPLRAFPQRYYFLDESNSSSSFDAQNGQRLAEILKRNKDIEEKINNWLKKFEINISVNEFKDIIHKINVIQNGLKLDITDVGFGYSQILPILVQGFMSENNSMTLIEQPEIHLHPKMQAALADLFIEIISSTEKNRNGKAFAASKQKVLLVETHSEYMLKRLRRRISEGTLSNEDVAIYFIESRNETNPESATIKKVNISDIGEIDWPRDFYITAYDDDMKFLERKIQISNE